jgi:predicted  nucleic acid-binding Zn-ribbon protein
MARVEERVAHLEGQVNELSEGLSDVRGTIRHLEQRVDVRFDAVDRRFDALDDKMSRHFDALDSKVSRQFVWLVGIVVTVLVAMVGTMLSRG